ncbi:MAG: methyl-accepting chemotaxis protein, partial [Chloroherpetonaceae bacterium]|nr:methyl-accepting chemotaxis protein [Chthonomonadaceae bacterium]MDW8209441.1 methyl-accepting chemotaxis protein [Chloroherpetonaceae bacterium]
MRWFADLKIAHKLLFGFGLCAVLSLCITVQSFHGMAQINANVAKQYREQLLVNRALADAETNLLQYRIATRDVLLAEKATQREKAEQDASTYRENFEKYLAELRSLVFTDRGRAAVRTLEENWQPLYRSNQTAMDLARQGKVEQAADVLKSGRPFAEAMGREFDEFTAFKITQGKNALQESEAIFTATRRNLIVLSLLVVAIGLGAGFLIARQITRPLQLLVQRMESLANVCLTGLQDGLKALAAGDFTFPVVPKTQPLPVTSRDETGKLSEIFNRALERAQSSVASYNQARHSLSQLITTVAESAGQVLASAQALSVSCEKADGVSTSIARSIQEVAQSAEQSATTSQEMARGSEQQAQAATEAAQAMEHLRTAVTRVQQGTQQQQQA